MSILEAINNSTPVIGSNVSGIRDLNLNNKGLVLFNNYPQELKRKILSFYYMKEHSLKKIITKQNEYLKKNHSEEDMYKKYSLIYKKLKRTIYT